MTKSQLLALGWLMMAACAGARAADLPREQPFNDGWRFSRVPDDQTAAGATGPDYSTAGDDGKWELVTLPHTARLEPARVQYPWQGVSWYRKRFTANPAWAGKKVFIEFGAAMHIADVWVNGKMKTRHLGGYLPFTIDLTEDLRPGEDVVIAVRLDNRDTQLVPPGKPLKGLDFVYPGGLYRGAKLIVTDPVHVTNAIHANVEAGGGIFVTSENVSERSATVRIKTHVANEGRQGQQIQVASRLLGPDGAPVGEAKAQPLSTAAGEARTFEQTIAVTAPKLWDTNRPHLYTLETTVLAGNTPVDRVRTKLGIRHIHVSDKALLLNGKRVDVNGTNRHQEYPYIGYALSPEAARRDARLIKNGGFNFVRLAHYPQDPAFLDACDELGLLVQTPIPGWQQFWNNESFIKTSHQMLRDMIRRDRNHPSIVLWETSLNETRAAPLDFRKASYEIAHKELPGDQCFTWGDPYSGSPWDVKEGMVREYGDWAFGGNNSTSRQTRGDGEKAMLQQAWNFIWTYNYLRRPSTDPRHAYMGAATWVMFDYNRGYHAKQCTCGMMDIFRLPKYVYYFYQSQRDPRVLRNDVDSGPMVFIANQWKEQTSPAKVVVFSNCDEVELQVNGKAVKRQKPDAGPDTSYSRGRAASLETVGNDSDRSGGNPFDGGNGRNLAHPPFTFTGIPWEAGAVKAVAYLDGKPAAQSEVKTPGKPAALRISFDTAGEDLRATGGDAIFVRAQLLDANGTVIPDANPPVQFQATGPATLLGQNPLPAEAGTASILLRATNTPGAITLTAESPGLPPATSTIISKSPEPITP